METIDWDQLALSAAERDLAGIVREIAARYAQQRPTAVVPGDTHIDTISLDWRTLVAIADEAEADIGLQARHEPWVLARLLRLPGDEALRRDGVLPSLDAAVDLQWPDAPAPAVFRAIVATFSALADDELAADEAATSSFMAGASALMSTAPAGGSACPA
ncbi:DUF2471 family protein [Pandoraea sputorum]|uniref:Protein of uncharacterized function (DUF2471) n=1 Tax=Pandoraea sputorum TaxID=93222 RepID=A0A239SCA9_9BURK|nr:DUF2471 family protein [Pandoraea sputorum]APD12309.1 hypothetical protein NA29_25290 [Pandoraea sputorum]SNU82548.1 Protein of uncharacterised function (DUF2471) [Pandoraea sputorum]VVE09733.1 hypothetical protein PSP20601_02575 [Pandoraea sputorum]